MSKSILRCGAIAAVAGALAQFVATVLEPEASEDAGEHLRTLADSSVVTGDRVLDLLGVLLTVAGLTVVGRTFLSPPGREWARLGQPFLVLVGALGACDVIAGAVLKDIADTWAGAAAADRQSYVASFDAVSTLVDDLFFAAFLALGIYAGCLAIAVLTGRRYRRWLGWTAAASALLVLAGDLLLLLADAAFVALLLGFALFLLVTAGLGVSLWRLAAHPAGLSRPASSA